MIGVHRACQAITSEIPLVATGGISEGWLLETRSAPALTPCAPAHFDLSVFPSMSRAPPRLHSLAASLTTLPSIAESLYSIRG